jgi:hypothetical protein
VICTASDQCHNAGTCNAGTGSCSNPAKADASACDDSDACTQTDTCTDGTCSGDDPVVCTASDSCHDAGICDPATGLCTDPESPDGTACDQTDACYVCQAGTCVGGAPKKVFATSGTYIAGLLGGLTGADAICAQSAVGPDPLNPILSGTYKAWISSSQGSPSSRFTKCGAPYVLADGTTVVANDWDDLTDGVFGADGAIAAPINHDERGELIPSSDIFSILVWTSTTPAGLPLLFGGINGDVSLTCHDWSSTASDAGISFGDFTARSGAWTEYGTTGCANNFGGRLYCFEQ